MLSYGVIVLSCYVMVNTLSALYMVVTLYYPSFSEITQSFPLPERTHQMPSLVTQSYLAYVEAHKDGARYRASPKCSRANWTIAITAGAVSAKAQPSEPFQCPNLKITA